MPSRNIKLAFTGVLLVTVLGFALTGESPGQEMAACKDCNILLISIEPLQKKHLSAYGYKRNTTPTLERLASKGTRFTNAYTTSGHTLEATLSTMTSLYPQQHGISPGIPVQEKRKPGIVRLAEVFKQDGYFTASIDSRGSARSRAGLKPGFTVYRYLSGGAKIVMNQTLKKNEGKPFFIYLQSFAPHAPYSAMPFPGNFTWYNWTREYSGTLQKRGKQWLIFKQEHRAQVVREKVKSRYERRFLTNSTFRKQEIAAYDAKIRSADHQINSVFRVLKRRNEFDNTIVIFVSQHGEMLGEHGKRGHSTLHEEVMNVALIMRVPGMEQKRRADEYVSILDIGPTLLDITGVESQEFRDQSAGTSLTPVLKGGGSLERRYLFATHFNATAAIDTHRGIKYMKDTYYGIEKVYNLSRKPPEPLGSEKMLEYMRSIADKYSNITGRKPEKEVEPYYG